MGRDGLERDSSREGKARQRSKRKSTGRRAEPNKEGWQFGRNDILPSLRIESYPIEALKAHVRKLRKTDSAHIRDIASSINALGFNVPVLIGKGNVVVDGASRLEAAKLLGLTSVPCIRVDHLEETEQRLLRLAVNRLGEKGCWDLDELEAEFNELIIADAPIEISGFDADEVEQLVNEVDEDRQEAVDVGPTAGSAIARPGDLFQLGAHRLICGDATDPAVIRRLMAAGVARLVFTHAPFDVVLGGEVTGDNSQEDALPSGQMTEVDFLDFNRRWIDAVLPCLVDGGVLGTFIDWSGLPIVHACATALGLRPLDLVVWAKARACPGSLYQSQYDLLPLFKKGSAPHVNNVAVGKRGRHRTNVWTYRDAPSIGSNARNSPLYHRSEKPIAMLEGAMIDLTNRGDIVLDPFLGSGSTLIAAENAGRVCRGAEPDPLCVDAIIRRYETPTRGTAVLADTGEPFAALAARRRHDEDSPVP